jgi:hypothetical protein
MARSFFSYPKEALMLLRLPRNVAALANLASNNEVKYALNGVKIRVMPDRNLVRLEATDGAMLGILQCYPEDDVEACESVVERQDLEPDAATEALIHAKDWKTGIKHPPKMERYAKDDSVVIATHGDKATFANLQGRMDGAQIEGRWPVVDNVMPQKIPLFKIRVDPKRMVRMLQTAMEFIDANNDRGVEIIYYGAGVPLGILVENADKCQVFDGLVVPLVRANGEPVKVERIEHKPDEDDEGAQQDEELPNLSELFYRVEYKSVPDGGNVEYQCLIPVPLADTHGMDEAFRRTMELEPERIAYYSMEDLYDADGELVEEWIDDSERQDEDDAPTWPAELTDQAPDEDDDEDDNGGLGEDGEAEPEGSEDTIADVLAGPLERACPACNAQPGEKCKNYKGKPCAPHSVRKH